MSLEPAPPAETRPYHERGAGPSGNRELLRHTVQTALLAGVYFVAAKSGLRLAFLHPSATPVWPPTGIAIAALLLLGVRAWPGVFAGAFAANVTTAGTVWTSLGIAAGNTLEAVTAAVLVTRYAGGRRAFESLETIARFVVAGALISTMVSATIGVTALALGGFAPWRLDGPVWLTWWLGDVCGALIVAPLLLLWSAAPRPGWTAAEAIERLIFLGALLVGSVAVFSSRFPFGFAIVPFLIWAAFRFGARDAVTAVVVVSAVAITGTVHRLGPFAVSAAQPNVSLLYLSLFMGLMAVIALTISRVVADRVAAIDELRRRVVAEEDARRAAEQAGEQAARLASVAAALSEAVTTREVAEVVVRHALETLGARAGGLALQAQDGAEMETVYAVGFPPEVVRRWQRFLPEQLGVLAECMRAGRVVALESEADIEAHYPEHDDLPEPLRHGARIAVPLIVARGRPIGVLSLTFGGPRRFGEDEITFTRAVGQQGAQAVERARLYEREHRAAETFQRALLPVVIPQVPGVAIHAVYQPGAREANVGGDWYDVFPLASGKIALSIGDVAGRGLAAAVVMGELRQTIRTAALDHDDPAAVLEHASRALGLAHGHDAMATAIVAMFDPVTSALSYATAGHPAPILAVPGSEPAALPSGGGPLGYLSATRTPSWTAMLPAGALVVLYTDGLVELNRDVRAGQEAVARASRREITDRSNDPARAILAEVLGDHEAADDVAIITLALDPVPLDRFDLTLRAEPGNAAMIRQTVLRLARAAALDEKRTVNLTVAVGEAVNNAIEHAYRGADGTVRVHGFRDAEAVQVRIADTGTWRPPRTPDGGGYGLTLIRELADSVDVQQTPGGTTVAITVRLDGGARTAAARPGESAQRPVETMLGAAGRDRADLRDATFPSDGIPDGRPIVTADAAARREPAGPVASVRSEDGLPVVEAAGDLDATVLNALRQALADAARRDGPAVVVSLERARYIDSLTIRQLFEFGRDLATRRRSLALVVPPGSPLERIAAIVGLTSQFRTFATAAEARAALKEVPKYG